VRGIEETKVQPIRHRIVEILKENGTATVAELAAELDMAQVSVRHHLDILIGEDMVTASGVRRRNGAGRPSQIYSLAPGAAKLFPQAHESLAGEMLREMKSLLPAVEVHGIFMRLAEKTASEAPTAFPGQSLEERLDQVTSFLSHKGYTARWERRDGHYEVFTCNCPYAGVSERHPEVCSMDQAMLTQVVGEPLHRESRIADGAPRCVYTLTQSVPELVSEQ
jgi:DeoR family transcriptional regulator, suf operon transcriptional repressor